MQQLKNNFLLKYNEEKSQIKALSRAIAASLQHNSLYKASLNQQQKNIFNMNGKNPSLI
jgi:hypothetical protein